MMQPITNTTEDLDMLFELFSEDLSDDIDNKSLSGESENTYDNDTTDDTSSESSGSSGHSQSPSFQQLSSYYPSPPSVVFAPNPLSCFTAETTQHSNKRTKTEEKLIRNRESANKSRLKRKNEKVQLEETVAALREKVRSLEMENNALLTDNTTLSQHNFFLQGLLKKQQQQPSEDPPVSPLAKEASSQSHMSALSGISMLCVVFSVSFFNEWLPSSLQSAVAGSDGQDSWSTAGGSSGRVLLSVEDEYDYDYLSLDPSSHHANVSLRYVLIVSSLYLYYFYVQYNSALHKKSSRLLPS